MDSENAKKCLNLLDNGNLEELRKILELELVYSSKPKGNTNLLKAVNTFLKGIKDKSRPQLKTIQIQEDNRQAVLDGFIGVLFDEHLEELDCLDSTPFERSIKLTQIIPNNNYFQQIDEDTKKLLKKIKCFLTLAKSTPLNINDEEKIILFNLANKWVDATKLSKLLTMMGNVDNLQMSVNADYSIVFRNDKEKITGIILMIRFKDIENLEVGLQEFNRIKSTVLEGSKC